MDTLFTLVIGIIIGLLLSRGFKSPQIAKIVEERSSRKEENKKKIVEYLKKNQKITNNEVEKLVSVSDSTATDYLQELEEEGKIEQQGKEGRSVYYQLK
tara:strand:- start:2821 stop:3117 length:297 start_codon:yes stop_codon:yes gene_type:complete